MLQIVGASQAGEHIQVIDHDELMAAVERVRSDSELRERFAQVGDDDGLLALLKELGVEATIDDVRQTIADMPLSEEELADVDGGQWSLSSINYPDDPFRRPF
jgi:predicted ribosomally synthesized peptide with nif11-like leader